MTLAGWLQVLLFLAILFALTKPVGRYLFQVFETDDPPWGRGGGRIEHGLLRLCGVDPKREQTWIQYAFSVLAFSLFSVLLLYLIQRFQHLLPLNPQRLGPVPSALAFNTAASFTTNTNWQAYAGESTLSYFTQMVGLTWQNFVSAVVGMCMAQVLARGLTRSPGPDGAKTLGNFWVDLIRGLLYVMLPACIVIALFFVSQGVLQNFGPYVEVTTVEGRRQLLAMGPVASQEAIKMLGTNGGGFFNANSAHPFENPTPLTNLVQMLCILVIPSALTWTWGRMTGDQRQGWAIWAAMVVLFIAGVVVTWSAEAQPNPATAVAEVLHHGNMEGKEVRFGIATSSLFAVVTTAASCGAVISLHDSFNALGGLVLLLNIQLGEVIFGGTGSGLYGILIFAILSVFIAGLMVGRTPEYVGKKIEAREMKLAMLYVLVFPLFILGLSAASAVRPSALASLNNAGPHGLSELLYAYSSGTGNNGSAFAGLNANTAWYNVTLGLVMLGGRFLMAVPVLAIAGSMLNKKVMAVGPGTFPTHGALFTGLLVGVILIVGALTFFPALSLGPIVEHFLARAGRSF